MGDQGGRSGGLPWAWMRNELVIATEAPVWAGLEEFCALLFQDSNFFKVPMK